uniref:Uncharacterized protein n=1 Tax=Oryzias sinensis TaxID=183150 RepID=A0A8C8DQ77_9TELE
MASKAGKWTKRKVEAKEEDKTSTEEKKARGENAHEEAVYGRNAEEVKSALLAARPELTVVCNPEKPRRNSFEITLLDGAKGE